MQTQPPLKTAMPSSRDPPPPLLPPRPPPPPGRPRQDAPGPSGAGAKRPPKVEGSKDDLFGAEVGKRRNRTEDGFAIYTEEELGLGRRGGGDTDLCPFDCDCCF